MLNKFNFLRNKKIIILVELLLLFVGIIGLFQKTGIVVDTTQTEKLLTEGISLPAGAYKATIWYKTDNDINKALNFTVDGIVQYKKLLTNPTNLLKGNNIDTCHFYLTSSTDSLKAQILNSGDESLVIEGIQIEFTNAGSRIFIFWVVLFSFIINGLIYISLRYQNGFMNNEKLLVVLGIPILAFIVSVPCFVDYILAGSECSYHISRIEYFTNQIINGEFYCDKLLVIPVLLRILGMNITMAYRLFIIFVNLITAIIAYYSLKKCFNNKLVGLMGCTLITMAPYRINSIYEKSAVGEFSIFIFLPLIILLISKIFHLCLIVWKKEYSKKSFLDIIKCLMIAILLIIYYIVPYKAFISHRSILTIFMVFILCLVTYYGLHHNWKVIPAKYLMVIICVVNILIGNYKLNSILVESDGYLKIYSSDNIDISTVMEEDNLMLK